MSSLKKNFLKNPVILALDVDSKDEALQIFKKVGTELGAVKVGPRLVYRYGADLIGELSKICPVFVDNKYFDIPSTMVSAVKASFEAGATLVTVHALAGREALTELSKLEKELNQIRPFQILAVTVLTSWDESSMPSNMKSQTVQAHVSELVDLVYQCGLRGIVCSAQELEFLRAEKKYFDELYLVTPGIRWEQEVSTDQKRTMTPAQALQAGASALVIGRPILKAADPVGVVREISGLRS